MKEAPSAPESIVIVPSVVPLASCTRTSRATWCPCLETISTPLRSKPRRPPAIYGYGCQTASKDLIGIAGPQCLHDILEHCKRGDDPIL
ncbi:Hypothetical protein NTJ_07217 [Nesidiocoris tenuis]|uniref:Uncharacterized protein n=1 Tax=Nesidiocoris tenuis TaxID=355587 RepID=A0ABN7AQC7_9HEMI|nr:Hypothetical protein NTJ_07217 [Nesidiocoris tenuis]